MAVHKIFRGDRTRCAQLYPMARSKLEILRTVMAGSGQTSASQRFDVTTGEVVFLYVNGTEEYIYITAGGDGYYCLGDLGGAIDYISASPTAVGAFAPRGQTPFSGFFLPQLYYVGRGYGALPDDDTQANELTIYETRRGITSKQVHAFSYATPMFGNDWVFHKSARAVINDNAEHSYGVAMQVRLNGEDYAGYWFTLDGADTWQRQITGYGGGIKVGVPGVIRYGPRDLWFFVPAFLGDDNNNIQSSYIQLSGDNGQTLNTITAGDIVTDIFFPAGMTQTTFNSEVNSIATNAVGVRLHNNTLDLLIATRSKVLRDETLKPKLYRMVSATDSTQYVTTLSTIAGDHGRFVGSVLLMCQDVPVFVATPDNEVEVKVLFVGDTEGVSWIQRAMPWPAHSTGTPTALNESIIVCTAYNTENGYYELHQTEDLGQSWQFRATVRTDAPPPDTNVATLLRFGILSILRQQDRPANSFPGQPWVGDDRITPPGV